MKLYKSFNQFRNSFKQIQADLVSKLLTNKHDNRTQIILDLYRETESIRACWFVYCIFLFMESDEDNTSILYKFSYDILNDAESVYEIADKEMFQQAMIHFRPVSYKAGCSEKIFNFFKVSNIRFYFKNQHERMKFALFMFHFYARDMIENQLSSLGGYKKYQLSEDLKTFADITNILKTSKVKGS